MHRSVRRWISAALLTMLLLLVWTGSAETGVVYEGEHPRTAFDEELSSYQIVAQTDPRFDTSVYQYEKARFVINGCGPATLHNGLAVAFRITDPAVSEAVLLEIMTITADFQDPSRFGVNYKRMSRLTEPICDQYETLTQLKTTVDSVVWVTKGLNARVLTKEVEKQKGSAVIMGRINLFQNWGEIIDLVDYLHAQGLDDATITVATLSAGTPSTGAPFNMGSEGHYITVAIQVGEYVERGSIYVLDSYPRSVRGEPLSEIYTKKYYFAENNKLTSFRQNYGAWHLIPTVVKCEPLPEVMEQLVSLREGAGAGKSAARSYRTFRIKLSRRITTYGTGTLLLRIR